MRKSMTVHITKKLEGPELEHIFLEAAYSGERFLMEGDEGFEVAIVPREDLQVLEELERIYLEDDKPPYLGKGLVKRRARRKGSH
jgi:hypothetical protein